MVVRSFLTALAFSVILLAPMSSQAGIIDPNSGGAPVGGKLAIAGDATVGATFLSFLCDIVSAMPCPAGSGNFNTSGAAALTGSFVPYAGDTGFIKSLNQSVQPLNSMFSLSNFLTFNPAGTIMPPDIVLDLTFIFLGTSGQAECGSPVNQGQVPAQKCTPVIPMLVTASNPGGLSPFNLVNSPTGSTASFNVAGLARRISTGAVTNFNGTLSATFTNTPGTTDGSYQALLAILSTGGTISTSYSATFNATVTPEPGTTALMLGGLLVLGGAGFRRFRKKRQES